MGYGLCGNGEPYLEATLNEFARLCDEVIICLNNAGEREKELITARGFSTVEDNREWGVLQWKIKEDFVKNHVAPLKPDLCVCMDMDEVFDKNFTKEALYELYKKPFEAFYFRIINLWDDGYNPDRSFWNIRAWKFQPPFTWPRKNVHCGLAPEWTWGRAYYVPYILKHYGLQSAERRKKKSERYDKYDPNAKFITPEYYKSLQSHAHVLPFDEDKLHQEVVDFVVSTNQKYIKPMEKEEYVEMRVPSGETIAIPKSKWQFYSKRPGHELLGDRKEFDSVIDKIIAGDSPVEGKPIIYTDEQKTTPTEEFMCNECSYRATSKIGLHAHKLGKHRNKERLESKKIWNWEQK